MPRVLVIDDDPGIRDLLKEYLDARGFVTATAPDGPEGLRAADADRHDLVVLDVMMPGMDGLEVLRTLRATSTVPVIMLTARGDDIDRIVGLELGADDYLAKPFNPRELVARIQAVLRRAHTPSAEPDAAVHAGPLTVDPARRRVTLDGEEVPMTTTEFELLRVLVARAGRVVQREQLMELARGEDFAAFDRSVDVHISHIRRKLGDPARQPHLVKTIRGVGYLVPSTPSWPPAPS
jgi:DNA-binding response OmpR family regulator